MKADKDWERRWRSRMKFLFSDTGKELQRCLVAQGYGSRLFWHFALMFGSEFTAAKLIMDLQKELDCTKG